MSNKQYLTESPAEALRRFASIFTETTIQNEAGLDHLTDQQRVRVELLQDIGKQKLALSKEYAKVWKNRNELPRANAIKDKIAKLSNMQSKIENQMFPEGIDRKMTNAQVVEAYVRKCKQKL